MLIGVHPQHLEFYQGLYKPRHRPGFRYATEYVTQHFTAGILEVHLINSGGCISCMGENNTCLLHAAELTVEQPEKYNLNADER